MSTHIAGERRSAILAGVVALLGEVGYDRLSFDAVASRVGASKATLYRHWSDKRSLVVEAVDQALSPPTTGQHSASLRVNLLSALCAPGGFAHSRVLPAIGGLISALTVDPRLAAALRDRVLAPHDDRIAGLIEQAQEGGEIDRVDVDLAREVVLGFVVYRASVDGMAVTADTLASVIDRVLPAEVGPDESVRSGDDTPRSARAEPGPTGSAARNRR